MNDRFKFRAWDKINDEWVKIPHLSLDVETGMLNGFFDYTEAAKRRYTLEQCTGLRDKNGKLIYEGDIVKRDVKLYRVDWCQDKLSFVLRSENNQDDILESLDITIWNWEIIGNIHENPELLEVKDD